MKYLFAILSGVLLLLILMGCAQEEDSLPVADESLEPATDPVVEPASEPEEVVCAQDVQECPDGSFVSRNPDDNCEFRECPEPEVPPLDDEIVQIQQKIKNLKSYEYLDSSTNHIVLVKGDKTVLITSDSTEFRYDDFSANAIYLDHASKKAYGACILDTNNRNTFQCGRKSGKYLEVDYNDIRVNDPFKDLKEMTSGEIVGSEGCERRQCDIIEYKKGDYVYRMWVRKTYVLPFKIARYDDESKIVSFTTFSNAAFDHLKNADVEIPENFKSLDEVEEG